jgi:hypothetical protein
MKIQRNLLLDLRPVEHCGSWNFRQLIVQFNESGDQGFPLLHSERQWHDIGILAQFLSTTPNPHWYGYTTLQCFHSGTMQENDIHRFHTYMRKIRNRLDKVTKVRGGSRLSDLIVHLTDAGKSPIGIWFCDGCGGFFEEIAPAKILQLNTPTEWVSFLEELQSSLVPEFNEVEARRRC